MNGRFHIGALVVASLIVLGAGQVALAQVNWTIGNVVVPPGPPGSWDEGGHMMGGVVFDGSTYHMYLLSGPGDTPLDEPWRVGHWWWDDTLQEWVEDPSNPVLEPEPGQWDGYSIGSIAVLYHGGMFHMWYGAAGAPLGPAYAGYATDNDGWGDWTKVAGPLPGLTPGAPGEWDDHGMGPKAVLVEGSELRMWYAAHQGGYWGHPWRLGHARSTDGGLSWVQEPDAPVLEASEPWEGYQVYSPTVVLHGGSYHMWYAGLLTGVSAFMGYANSSDGLNWRKWPGNPVLTGLPGCYVVDSIAVLLQGNTIHGWVSHCSDIRTATSSFLLADDFETGTTDAWSFVMP